MKEGSSGRDKRLAQYRSMRDFEQTTEPSGERGRSESRRSFVVQKHAARRLHFDFRLELDGVLLSWAIPKGPSLSPGDKRLAVQTEDHPIDYRNFEGTIPEGQYGGGAVIVWDRGTWTPSSDPHEGMKKGHLEFELHGDKLHGGYHLVRTRSNAKKPQWLLIKRSDAWAATGDDANITEREPGSVLTGRTVEDVLAGVPMPPRGASNVMNDAPSNDAVKPKELPPFGSIEPALATPVDVIPSEGPWVYEIKYDGYRAMAWLDEGTVRLASRRGLDWTSHYASVADALSRVRAKTAVFDGEIAYVLEDGRTSFAKLQTTLHSGAAADVSRLVYFVFDLLFYDGIDLRDEPLSIRKDFLRTILAGEGVPLRMSEHLEDGRTFFHEIQKLGLEGIVGKRLDSPYPSGRSRDWIKLKCHARQELVIVGYTRPKGKRRGIGALLLGLYEGKELRYAGKVGTGFSAATLEDLSERLGKIEVPEPVVANPPRLRGVKWVTPKLVGEVRFADWTSDGVLRQPSFEGLRLDKPAREVQREIAQPTPTVRFDANPRIGGVVVTHPERVMDPESGLTKLDLVRYADAVALTMLPYVAMRPLMLLRCPSGIETNDFGSSTREKRRRRSSCFVQKHPGQGLTDGSLETTAIGDEATLYATTAGHLVTLAQNNAIELHGWGSRLPDWDHPDWIVFDLDPDEPLPFNHVVESAFEMRDALATLGLSSWVKTTGGKGLHVVVPVARRYDWTTIRNVSEQIARLMTAAAPDRYVANMSKRARARKVFIDYLRNAEGATAILPYSARGRTGLTVALPMAWEDLRSIDPRELTIRTVPKLLSRRRADPWAELLGKRQLLPRELLDAVADSSA